MNDVKPMSAELKHKTMDSIMHVTLFLEKSERSNKDMAHFGPALIALDLEGEGAIMVEGTCDVLIASLKPDNSGDYDIGWLSSKKNGRWLHLGDTVVDPYLYERLCAMKPAGQRDFVELPIVLRSGQHEGPADVVHHANKLAEITNTDMNLHRTYREWRQDVGGKLPTAKRLRHVLDEAGIDQHQETIWGQVVKIMGEESLSQPVSPANELSPTDLALQHAVQQGRRKYDAGELSSQTESPLSATSHIKETEEVSSEDMEIRPTVDGVSKSKDDITHIMDSVMTKRKLDYSKVAVAIVLGVIIAFIINYLVK